MEKETLDCGKAAIARDSHFKKNRVFGDLRSLRITRERAGGFRDRFIELF